MLVIAWVWLVGGVGVSHSMGVVSGRGLSVVNGRGAVLVVHVPMGQWQGLNLTPLPSLPDS